MTNIRSFCKQMSRTRSGGRVIRNWRLLDGDILNVAVECVCSDFTIAEVDCSVPLDRIVDVICRNPDCQRKMHFKATVLAA